MIIHSAPQGTPEWRRARAGIPTASRFSEIITQKTLKLSAQADAYENRIVAEILTGNPVEDFGGTMWIDRGKELEGDAVKFYEMREGVDCDVVGFVTNDARTFGASPDRLIPGKKKGLELKCPAPQTHIGYLLNPLGAYPEYKAQVQGNMLATGFDTWDVMSYHPELPEKVVTIERDEEFLKILAELLEQFQKNVSAKVEQITGNPLQIGA